MTEWSLCLSYTEDKSLVERFAPANWPLYPGWYERKLAHDKWYIRNSYNPGIWTAHTDEQDAAYKAKLLEDGTDVFPNLGGTTSLRHVNLDNTAILDVPIRVAGKTFRVPATYVYEYNQWYAVYCRTDPEHPGRIGWYGNRLQEDMLSTTPIYVRVYQGDLAADDSTFIQVAGIEKVLEAAVPHHRVHNGTIVRTVLVWGMDAKRYTVERRALAGTCVLLLRPIDADDTLRPVACPDEPPEEGTTAEAAPALDALAEVRAVQAAQERLEARLEALAAPAAPREEGGPLRGLMAILAKESFFAYSNHVERYDELMLDRERALAKRAADLAAREVRLAEAEARQANMPRHEAEQAMAEERSSLAADIARTKAEHEAAMAARDVAMARKEQDVAQETARILAHGGLLWDRCGYK